MGGLDVNTLSTYGVQNSKRNGLQISATCQEFEAGCFFRRSGEETLRPYIHPVLFGLFRWFPVQQLSEFGSSEFGRTLVYKAKNANAAAGTAASQSSVQAELKPKTLLLFGRLMNGLWKCSSC